MKEVISVNLSRFVAPNVRVTALTVHLQGVSRSKIRIIDHPNGLKQLLEAARYETLMPCGYLYVLGDVEDIPLVDTGCPCGNPNHWLVKWDD